MNNQFETLSALAHALEDNGPHGPRDHLPLVRDVLAKVESLGRSDKVFAFDDSVLGLPDRLTPELLQSPVYEVDDDPSLSDQVAELLEVGSRVLHLANADRTDDHQELIAEDLRYRGIARDE